MEGDCPAYAKKPDDLQLIANHPVFQFEIEFFPTSFKRGAKFLASSQVIRSVDIVVHIVVRAVIPLVLEFLNGLASGAINRIRIFVPVITASRDAFCIGSGRRHDHDMSATAAAIALLSPNDDVAVLRNIIAVPAFSCKIVSV